MKQRCHVLTVWLTWIIIPALAVVFWMTTGWIAAVLILLVGIAAQVLYVRSFPGLARWLGYGSVKDVSAPDMPAATGPSLVTLYTASVCPFCPIVRKRLLSVQTRMGFEINEVDITFRLDVVKAQRIRSVPVIESTGKRLVGNVTTAQIVDFLVSD